MIKRTVTGIMLCMVPVRSTERPAVPLRKHKQQHLSLMAQVLFFLSIGQPFGIFFSNHIDIIQNNICR